VIGGVVVRGADVRLLAAGLQCHGVAPVVRTSSLSPSFWHWLDSPREWASDPQLTAQRTVVILGSTGSIGTQAIDVARAAPDRFRVTAICAGGADPAALAEQAAGLQVEVVGIGRAERVAELRARLDAIWPADTHVRRSSPARPRRPNWLRPRPT